MIASALSAAACTGGGDSVVAAPSAVVAVSQDQPLVGRTARVVARVAIHGGELLLEQEVEGSDLPFEVMVPALAPYTRVTATVEAFDSEGTLLVRRIAATDVARGRTILLRTRLQDECILGEAEHDVRCDGLTCRAGACEIPFVAAHRLEDYAPGWELPTTAACGAVGDGEPSLVIGKAEPPFEPFVDGETVVPQMGHQGASHFFFSVRMRDAHPLSVRTLTRGTVLSTGRETNAVMVGDPYDDDCGLFMIPFVLPPEGAIDELMRLEAAIFDHTENAGNGRVELLLAEPLPPI
jgi:hypothetical protein